eukprot:5065333-Prymnesium_polylepis.1
MSLGVAHREALVTIRAEQRDGGSVPFYPYSAFSGLVRAIGFKFTSVQTKLRYEQRAFAVVYVALETYL